MYSKLKAYYINEFLTFGDDFKDYEKEFLDWLDSLTNSELVKIIDEELWTI